MPKNNTSMSVIQDQNTSPFIPYAPILRANGYSILPLMPNSKRPAIDKWSEFCVNPADDETFRRWMKWQNCGIGVCLGVASNLVAVDYDYDIDGLHEKIKQLLPESPVGKVGAKGCTIFYQFNGQKSQGYNRNGERVLDVLSTGRQTVLPPTIHPDTGKAYTWMTDKTLLNTLASELPQIPLQAMYDIGNLITPEVQRIAQPRQVQVYDDTTMDEVAEAISYIPADDYDIWYRVGMCIKHKFGEVGFGIWDNWSATSVKYKGHEMRNKWNSFHGQGLTVASLFYYARDYGYVPSGGANYEPEHIEDFILNGKKTGWESVMASAQRTLAPTLQFTQEEGTQPKMNEAPTPKEDTIILPSHLLEAPGLVGMLAAYVNETALTPQPILSLGASIAMAGALMGRKVRGPSGLRTNVYAMGLAPSGAGKDHARSVFKKLLLCAGYSNIELPVPASSAGLVSSLREQAEGRGIVLWDEFGRILKQLTGMKAGNHERDIVTAMIELFSSAQSTYLGKGYANHDGKNPTRPIEQPCLCVYGTSVPSNFYEALTGSDAVDGFLSRWLIFESKDYSTEIIIPDGDTTYDVPQHLIDECKKWKTQPWYNGTDKSNLVDATQVLPKLIPYSQEAKQLLLDYAKETRIKTRRLEEDGENTAPVWARAGEHAMRLALIGHDAEEISKSVAAWAIGVTDYCCNCMDVAIKEYVASTVVERNLNLMLKIIASGNPWVTKSCIAQKARKLATRERGDALASLMEAGDIIEDKVPGATKPTSRYRLAKPVKNK